MHFLINDSDNSVNCVSEEMFPQFMIHEGLTYRELPVDHLPADTVLFLCFYDPETNSIIPNAQGLVELTKQEFQEYIDQQQAIQKSIAQSADADKYTKLVNFLAQVFPDNPTITAMLSDNTVTQDELQQIEDMLNAK
jgi:hypothetical protein